VGLTLFIIRIHQSTVSSTTEVGIRSLFSHALFCRGRSEQLNVFPAGDSRNFLVVGRGRKFPPKIIDSVFSMQKKFCRKQQPGSPLDGRRAKVFVSLSVTQQSCNAELSNV